MSRFRRSDIYRRTLLSILAISLAPLGMMSWLALGIIGELPSVAVGRSCRALERKATKTASAVADFLRQREEDLRTAAALPRTTDAYLSFSRRRVRELSSTRDGREARLQVPLYHELAYVRSTGREALKIVDGRVAAAEDLRDVSNPANTAYKGETYFLEARKLTKDKVHVSHVTGFYVSKAEFKAGRRFRGVLRFTMPVFDKDGRFDGVVTLALDGRHLQELVTRVVHTEGYLAVLPDPGPGDYAFLVDDQDHVVVHPRHYLIAGVGPAGERLPEAATEEEIGVKPVRMDRLGFVNENLARLADKAAKGESGSLPCRWEGPDVFVAYAPVPYFSDVYKPPAGLGWVGISADLSKEQSTGAPAGATLQDEVAGIIAATLGILAVIVLLVLVVANRVATRMHDEWTHAQQAEASLRQANKSLEAANHELERLSNLDGLTQIANRRRFDGLLSQEWRRALRNGSPISIILVDVDFFKAYNDTYGHEAGDTVLKEVALALSTAVGRASDLVARYGGEEFIVALPGTGDDDALFVAERMRASVEALQIPHAGSQVGPCVTISVGVANAIPRQRSQPDALVRAADEALYEAKRGGRNRVVSSKAQGLGDMDWGR